MRRRELLTRKLVATLLLTMLAATTINVFAYDKSETHPYMCNEAEEIFSTDEIQQYLPTIQAGATHEDAHDHIFGLTIKTITHFWDADDGDADKVALLGVRYPNAWMKVIELWNDALDFYDFGDKEMAYERLGHVAHLIQDMSLPAHAHEDMHLLDPVGDDCYEDWMKSEGVRERWTSADAIEAGGLITIPSDTTALYHLMYTTNQYADYFASDDKDGDTYDRHGWIDYNGWSPTPTVKEDLNNNDILPDDNDNDYDLTRIAQKTYVYAIRATATLFKTFVEAVAAEEDSTIPSIIPPSFRVTGDTACETYLAVELKDVGILDDRDPDDAPDAPNFGELELATFVYADGVKEPQACLWPRKDNGSSWHEIDTPYEDPAVDQINVNMPIFAKKESEIGDALAIIIVAKDNDERPDWLETVLKQLFKAGPDIGKLLGASEVGTAVKIAEAFYSIFNELFPEFRPYGIYTQIHLKSEWQEGYVLISWERARPITIKTVSGDQVIADLYVSYEIKKVQVPLRTPPVEVKLKGIRASSWATHDELGDHGEVFIKTRVLIEEAYKQGALAQLKEYGTKETGGSIDLGPDAVWRPPDLMDGWPAGETLFHTDVVGPFLYLEIGIWDKDAGSNNDMVGLYSRTFWPDEIWGIGSWMEDILPPNLGRWLVHQQNVHQEPQYVTVEFEINYLPFSDVSVLVTPGPNVLNIIPGTMTPYAVEVLNMGNIEEQFSLSVEGLDPSWFTWGIRIGKTQYFNEGPSNNTLAPGDEWLAWLLVTPPRYWTTAPGKYEFTVKATTASAISASDTSNINVLTFLEVNVTLSPPDRIIRAGQEATYTVGVKNLGNVPATYDLSINCTDFNAEWATLWPNTFWDLQPGSISCGFLQISVPDEWNEESTYSFVVSATNTFVKFVVLPNDGVTVITIITTDNATGTFNTVPLSPGEGGIAMKLSEGLDYLFMEDVKIRITALLTDAITHQPVSDGSINLFIYYPDGTLWLTETMTEITGTGIYEWQSDKTLRDMMKGSPPNVIKGVYIAHATTTYNGHMATDIIELHVDPPAEQPVNYWEYMQLLIASAALIAFAAFGFVKTLKVVSARRPRLKA